MLSVKKFDFKILKEYGIEYISPIDLSSEKLNINVDFIYSQSVLEHVPINDISKLLKNLTRILNPSGTMIHCIHLEDHMNIPENPFSFLGVSENLFTNVVQSTRGNRIRSGEWSNIFNNISDIKTEFIYSYSRKDKLLPKFIDPSISYSNENDLRISHIGVYNKKIL
ncbi:MAG: class I SAM-dependent methyltransferase [bacterium]|nr:class I SAM-dependent methyltransferase [bacterium]